MSKFLRLASEISSLKNGLSLCIGVALLSTGLGSEYPTIGSPVFGVLIGMLLHRPLTHRGLFERYRLSAGINLASKQLLQGAVILLGFGLNLSLIVHTGRQSLPIICISISAGLGVAYLIYRSMKGSARHAILIGAGSSICGGSAVAATAAVIKAQDEEITEAIAVVFFFNVIAALTFPAFGVILGLDSSSGEVFGIFAGSAVNDTSSVTATASTWDAMHGLGTQTLDKAVTVKLTRTLAIIPLTLVLSHSHSQSQRNLPKVPPFIIGFIFASLLVTLLSSVGVSTAFLSPLKILSKFLIVIAMVAIGLNTDLLKLTKTGKSSLLLGGGCWIAVTLSCLSTQRLLHLW